MFLNFYRYHFTNYNKLKKDENKRASASVSKKKKKRKQTVKRTNKCHDNDIILVVCLYLQQKEKCLK